MGEAEVEQPARASENTRVESKGVESKGVESKGVERAVKERMRRFPGLLKSPPGFRAECDGAFGLVAPRMCCIAELSSRHRGVARFVNSVHEWAVQERDVVSGMAVFVAVVEGGSLAAAARSTGLTPSAVSKLVTRLEDGFGTQLLRRTTRRLTLTDAGQVSFDRSRTTLEDLRAVEQEMASQSHGPRGRLRVTAPQLFGQTTVLPLLLAFLKKAPAVSLDLELTDRSVDLVGERVDIAVRITTDPPSAFVARRVGEIGRVLCATPGYLRAHGTPRGPF